MNPAEIMAVLDSKKAVLRGHFLLSSGRHSDVYVQKFRVLEHPRLAQRFGEAIAEQFDCAFDVVAAPAVGAVVLGFAVGLAGNARVIFAERVDDELRFRRGFTVEPRESVLVVEDVVTTGSSALEVVELVKAASGEVAGVGALLDRTDPDAPPAFGAPFRALVRIDAESWDPEDCPLCRAGEPLADPGSRRL